jgi:hypothetical protein
VADFHPRYGFTFSQNVSGIFICESEGIKKRESLTVVAIQNPETSYSGSTEYGGYFGTVECDSKGAVQVCQHFSRSTALLSISKKEGKLDGEGQSMSSYELDAMTPGHACLTCVDENQKEYWRKLFDFVRK